MYLVLRELKDSFLTNIYSIENSKFNLNANSFQNIYPNDMARISKIN
jgi:hypothetical protein